ncbi:hypothetical protein AC1031_004508 [Aphanomyces cochlioides]|nr:hypothetical protein AC1031_004508 [Aphanomyces cochlioides]
MLQQNQALQQAMSQAANTSKRTSPKKKDPPTFSGRPDEDLALWIFSTEEYYDDYKEEMRDYDLRFSGSQSGYTSKYLQLLNKVEVELPEIVKRWFYQQNLRAETSTHIFTNVPADLAETIELAQRYEDAKAASKPKNEVQPTHKKAASSNDNKNGAEKPKVVKCHACGEPGHYAPQCPSKSHSAGATKKKLDSLVGRRPTRLTRDATPGSTLYLSSQPDVDESVELLMAQSSSFFCYLAQFGTVGDAQLSIFVDSGASLNAVSPAASSRLGLQVIEHDKPLRLQLGSSQSTTIPRRVTSLTLRAGKDFPPYTTDAFVLDVPEGHDMLLGMPWLRAQNPDIDWTSREISPRRSVSDGPSTSQPPNSALHNWEEKLHYHRYIALESASGSI